MADLTDLAPLDPSLWGDGVQSVVADMQGRPLNIHRQIAHHPELLKAWWSFRNHCVHGCSLSARHRELVVLRTAHHVQSEYEWLSHVDRGLQAGLSQIEIERVRETPPVQPLFSAAEVLDLMAINSTYLFLARVAKTWNVELDLK